ncbi:MAG: PA0069 family radical SAM protein [Planctomycetota bacterium]
MSTQRKEPVANRFERIRLETDDLGQEDDFSSRDGVDYLSDESKSVVVRNESPDLGFDYSLNPYRGCTHACAYCYARPTHEYLGFSADQDFETKILVKRNAPELFDRFLRRSGWDASPVAFSGVTDCYQPIERKLNLTAKCLEVADRFSQPVSIVTKNALVEKDIDRLISMSRRNLVHVYLSITTLDRELASRLEPGTSSPRSRIDAVKRLSDSGVPTGVVIAPVIPGLTDDHMASIIEAAAKSGAIQCRYSVLRLPGAVRPVFFNWLRRHFPDRVDRVKGRIEALRDGQLNDSAFGSRMRGSGEAADWLAQMFRAFTMKFGVRDQMPEYNRQVFKVPNSNGQLSLFD